MNKELEDIINYIVSRDEYKKCISLKEKMSKNEKIVFLVENIKTLQKKYVKANDENILCEIEDNKRQLEEIPIYISYMEYLEKVNQMISYVNDELNDYFYKLLN